MQTCTSECYVINLEKRSDKLKSFVEELQKSGISKYHRLKAVKGIQPAVIKKLDLEFDHSALNVGEIGCFCSHMSLIRHQIDHQIPYILVFEDDVQFCTDFLPKWQKVIRQFESNPTLTPGVLYLGGRTQRESLDDGFLERDINGPSPYYEKPVYQPLPPHLLHCNELVFMGAFSYCLSLKSARLLWQTAHSKTINKPFDLFMTITHHHRDGQMYYAQPLLTISRLDYGSDIATDDSDKKRYH